jgi:hypothetical protein
MTKRFPNEYGNREERYRKALEKIAYGHLEPRDQPWEVAREALAEPEYTDKCPYRDCPKVRYHECPIHGDKPTQECDNRGNCALFPGPFCKNCEKPKPTQAYVIDREKVLEIERELREEDKVIRANALSDLVDCLVPLERKCEHGWKVGTCTVCKPAPQEQASISERLVRRDLDELNRNAEELKGLKPTSTLWDKYKTANLPTKEMTALWLKAKLGDKFEYHRKIASSADEMRADLKKWLGLEEHD